MSRLESPISVEHSCWSEISRNMSKRIGKWCFKEMWLLCHGIWSEMTMRMSILENSDFTFHVFKFQHLRGNILCSNRIRPAPFGTEQPRHRPLGCLGRDSEAQRDVCWKISALVSYYFSNNVCFVTHEILKPGGLRYALHYWYICLDLTSVIFSWSSCNDFYFILNPPPFWHLNDLRSHFCFVSHHWIFSYCLSCLSQGMQLTCATHFFMNKLFSDLLFGEIDMSRIWWFWIICIECIS